MKKALITATKFIAFFLGWALLVSVLPPSASGEPALWRLWAEVAPLLAIMAFTYLFWRLEKKRISLHLFAHPLRGTVLGVLTGVVWLGLPVLVMCGAKIIHFGVVRDIRLFPVWLLAAFLNVVMQELLVRGYLYQMIRQTHHPVAAAVATTALFTLLHGGAVEAGLLPVCNVVTMSLLMTAVLEYSGSLVAPIWMHALWNSLGALVLGGVSLAEDYPALLSTTFTGNELLSGGICKLEGSILVLFVNVALLFVFICRIQKRKAT